MARCARAGAAAIGIDARHGVLHSRFHHRLSDGRVDDVFFAVVLDVRDLRHCNPQRALATNSFIGRDISSITFGGSVRLVWINIFAPRYSAGRFTASTAISLSPL